MPSRISSLGRIRWAASVCIALAVVAIAPAALAHGGGASGPPPGPSDLAPGPIKRAILDLQRELREIGGPAELIRAPVDAALGAVERARGARAADDRPHAALLDKLAEQWVSAAQAVLRAAALERQAQAEAERQRDLETKVQRAQALLTEQQARLGRLQLEVKKAEERVGRSGQGTLSAERRRVGVDDPSKATPAEPSPTPYKTVQPEPAAAKPRPGGAGKKDR